MAEVCNYWLFINYITEMTKMDLKERNEKIAVQERLKDQTIKAKELMIRDFNLYLKIEDYKKQHLFPIVNGKPNYLNLDEYWSMVAEQADCQREHETTKYNDTVARLDMQVESIDKAILDLRKQRM